MRKSNEIILGFFFLFIGIGVMIGAIGLELGQSTDPKPGFFPFMIGVALTVISGILILKAWREHTEGVKAFGNPRRPTLVILGVIIYISFISLLGYVIATTIFSMILLRVLDTKKWLVVVVGSLTMAIASYLLFDRLLNVTLPAGILACLG